MEWSSLGQFPSGITLWEPVVSPESYRDMSIHTFDAREGYTVSFGLHQVSRFKSVEDAMKFASDLVTQRKAIDDKLAAKEARKAKGSKKHVDNLVHV